MLYMQLRQQITIDHAHAGVVKMIPGPAGYKNCTEKGSCGLPLFQLKMPEEGLLK